MSRSARTAALQRYRPEPARWWVAQTPVSWPWPPGLWTHLSNRALGRGEARTVPTLEAAGLDDLVYLPPVAPGHREARRALRQRIEAAGLPVLSQRQPDDPDDDGEDPVVDLLATLTSSGVAALGRPAGRATVAVWPLISGVSDDPRDWRRGLEGLARAGFQTVVPMAIDLSPAERRELAAYTDASGFQALFHGPAPDELAFAGAAAACGLTATPPRPFIPSTPRREFSRTVATELAAAADLWLRLGRGEAAGQELLRGARWAEDSDLDLKALAREGNLGVLPWLRGEALRLVEELAEGRGSSLRRSLEGAIRERAR